MATQEQKDQFLAEIRAALPKSVAPERVTLAPSLTHGALLVLDAVPGGTYTRIGGYGFGICGWIQVESFIGYGTDGERVWRAAQRAAKKIGVPA